jgi:hypothetical protein
VGVFPKNKSLFKLPDLLDGIYNLSIYKKMDFFKKISGGLSVWMTNMMERNINFRDVKEQLEGEEKEILTIQCKEEEWDIIVVGGGPSGITCAYEFSKNQPDKKVLLLEKSKWTLNDYKDSGYDDATQWFAAQNDPRWNYSFLSENEKSLMVGRGLGGGTNHFGGQWIDFLDFVIEFLPNLVEQFKKLVDIFNPQRYNYDILENKSYQTLFTALNNSDSFDTYNNRLYCSNLQTNKRILPGEILEYLPNVKVKYDISISRILKEGDQILGVVDENRNIYKGKNYVLSAGALATPEILLKSGITERHTVYDHASINLVYVKQKVIESKKVVNIYYTERELKELGLNVYNIGLGNEFDLTSKELNSYSNMTAIFRLTEKLTSEDIENINNGILPKNQILLQSGMDGFPYVFDMQSFWSRNSSRPRHPGPSLERYLGESYDLTSTLLGRHGNNFWRLLKGKAKVIGIKGEIREETEVVQENLGFNPENYLNHLQTRDKDLLWQTYLSFLPGVPNYLVATYATSTELSHGEIRLDNENNLIVKVNYNEKDINNILKAYNAMDPLLKKLGYSLIDPRIQVNSEFINQTMNSIYHYHASCVELVDENYKMKDFNNLFISDLSVVPLWPGSTSVPGLAVGLRVGQTLSWPDIKYDFYESNEGDSYHFVKNLEDYFGYHVVYKNKEKKEEKVFFDFSLKNNTQIQALNSWPEPLKEPLKIEIFDNNLIINNIEYFGKMVPYIEDYEYIGTLEIELFQATYNIFISKEEIEFADYYKVSLATYPEGQYGFGDPIKTDYNSDRIAAVYQLSQFKEKLPNNLEKIVGIRFPFNFTNQYISWVELDKNYEIKFVEFSTNFKGRYALAQQVIKDKV